MEFLVGWYGESRERLNSIPVIEFRSKRTFRMIFNIYLGLNFKFVGSLSTEELWNSEGTLRLFIMRTDGSEGGCVQAGTHAKKV